MSGPVLRAVVLAGGQSTRMGTSKLALRLGSKSVLERIVHELAASRVDAILVVLGPASEGLAANLTARADVLLLDRQTPDMRCTIEAALDHLESHSQTPTPDGLLICLADQPTLKRDTVNRLVEAYRFEPSRMFVPVYQGRRGHPIVLPWEKAIRIREVAPEHGLNVLLRDERDPAIEIVVDDPDVLLDLDEPSDFEALCRRPWD